MKAVPFITLPVFCLMLTGTQLRAEADEASSGLKPRTVPATVADEPDAGAAATTLTNLMEQFGRFAPKIQIESLTLNLNGYALVGLINTLNSPVAEQLIGRSASQADQAAPTDVSGVTTQSLSRIESREEKLQLNGAEISRLAASQTNLLAVVSNLLQAAKQSGVGLHIGRMTLNLNGYALAGVTNSLEGLNATQHLTSTHSVIHAQTSDQSKATQATRQTIRLGNVEVDLNGSAALSLKLDAADTLSPAVAPGQR
jgi:hypothetical protein